MTDLIADAKGAAGSPVEAAYRLYWGELCAYIAKKFGSGPPEPEDVAQAAFARFAALEDPQNIGNPRAFIYRTAHNIAVDHLRRKKTRQSYADDAVAAQSHEQSDDFSPERVLLAKERLETIASAIRRMPKRQARILVMNRVDGLSFVEIARRMNMSESNVKKLMGKSLGQCEDALLARGLPASGKNES